MAMKIMKIQYLHLMLGLMLTVVLTACAGDPTVNKAERAVQDTAIAAQVKAALIADHEVKGTQINVDVDSGVVQLRGVVDKTTNVQKAITIARSVEGVRAVHNHLVMQ